MATFFALVFLVSLIAMLVGLVKPDLFKKFNSTNSRVKILFGGIGMCLISLALVGVFAPEVDKKEPQKTETSAEPLANVEKEEVVKADENLGMTPEQFRKSFNNKLNELDVTSVRPLGEFNIKTGSVRDVFQVNFSDDISLTGGVNKDGMLHGLTFIVVPGENSERTMIETLLLTGLSANIVSKPEDVTKSKEVVIDLLEKALKNVDKEKNINQASVGNISYFSTAGKTTGLWFTIEPVENK